MIIAHMNHKALEAKKLTKVQLLEALEIAKGYIALYKVTPGMRTDPEFENACIDAICLLGEAAHFVHTHIGSEVGTVLAVERYV